MISELIPEISEMTRMYEQDSAFICALIEKFRPKKIVEVGIASGGTSAVIMQCMKQMDMSCSLYGIDILDGEYASTGHDVGYLALKAAGVLDFHGCRLFKGVCLPEVIEEVGGGIDMLILDTTHKLPGETLDFLVAFPYLSDDAVVCLHDIRQNHSKSPKDYRIGTSALFNSVAADKYISGDASREPDYPNIGAFRLNEDTGKYLTNVFGALTFTWSYSFTPEIKQKYQDMIHSSFSENECWIFDRAMAMNENTLRHRSMMLRQLPQVFHGRVRKPLGKLRLKK